MKNAKHNYKNSMTRRLVLVARVIGLIAVAIICL